MAATGLAAASPQVRVHGDIVTPDVVAYGDTTLVPALRALATDFRRRTRVAVRVFGNLGPQSLRLIAHGARCDVVMTQTSWLRDPAWRQQSQPAAEVGDWRDPTVLVARGGPALAAPPSAAVLTALLAGGRLGVIDPTEHGGPDGPALVARMGWRAGLAGEIDGPGVAMLVRTGQARLGLLPRSAALAAPPLAIIATLPEADAPRAAYAAAAARNAASSNTLAFLQYLTTSPAGAILQLGGLDIAS